MYKMKLYLRNLNPLPELFTGETILTLECTEGKTNADGEMIIFQKDFDACKIIKDYKDDDEKKLLIELNKREFSKLKKKIKEVDDLINTTNPNESALIEHLNDELTILDELEKQFYSWFKSKNVSVLGLDARLKVKPSVKEDTNDAQWAIADDMRKRKEDGEFDTYIEAYRWAQDNMTQNGEPIIAERLQSAFLKARCEGKVD